MSEEIFGIGFGIDTSGLTQGQAAAMQTAGSLKNLANALAEQERASLAAASAHKANADAAAVAAAKSNEAAAAARTGAQAADQAEAAVNAQAAAILNALRAHQQEVEATRRAEEATRRAEEATRKKADADRKAAADAKVRADAEAKAAAEAENNSRFHVRLANALEAVGLKAQTGGLGIKAMSQAALGAGNALGSGQGLGGVLEGVGGSLMRLMPSMGGLGGALGVATGGSLLLAGAFATLISVTGKQQEEYALLEGRLKNIYGSASAASSVFGQLTDMAQKNGMAINQTAESYLRMARNNEAIGLTTAQLLDMTDAVQKLGRVSGASQGEMASAMLQFSQAMASGRLNGDELRSIMEQMPALTKAIADGLGVSVGQIRAMGAAGELTSDKITGALLKQLPKINEEFANLPETSSQSFQRVANNWDLLLSNMGQALNSSGIMVAVGDMMAAAVGAAAEAVRPETTAERYQRTKGIVEGTDFRSHLATPGGFGGLPGGASEADQKAFRDAQTDMIVEYYQGIINQAKENKQVYRAPYMRSEGVVKEIDPTAKNISEVTNNIKLLQDVVDRYNAKPELFEKAEVERIQKYPGYIAALQTQLSNMLPVYDAYLDKTAKMRLGAAAFGPVAGAGIAEEAKALIDSPANKGQNIGIGDAVWAVIDRRTASLEQQTAALNKDIAVQTLATEAIGKGSMAEIDAQVAQKRLNEEVTRFGNKIGPDQVSALDAFAEKTRALLIIQKEAADAQRLWNEQVQLGITAQINAAIQNGQTQGQVEALRRSLSAGAQFTPQLQGAAGSVMMGGGAGAVPSQYQGAIDAAAAATGVPASVIAAMIQRESGFNPNAVSPTGAVGLMQILPSTAKDPGYGLSPRDPSTLTDPVANITFGAQYFRARANNAGLDISTPQGLAAALRLYNGSSTAQGDKNYAENVMQFLPTGAQAVAAGASASDAAAMTGTLQHIADLEKQAQYLIAQGTAKTAAEAASMARQKEVDDAVGSAAPGQEEAVRAAVIAKQQADDKAYLAEKLRSQTSSADQAVLELSLAGKLTREKEIQLRLEAAMRDIRDKGMEVPPNYEQELRKQITKEVDAKHLAEQTVNPFVETWKAGASAIGSSLESAIREGIMTGKIEGDKILKSLIADIATAAMHQYITKPFVDMMGNMVGSADGNVFSGGRILAFASGGVFHSPRIFPMAGGAGMLGEAGPEAVMPLTRNANGKLGVVASGGGGNSVIINDYRSASAPALEQQESVGPDGRRALTLTIRDEVRDQIKGGAFDAPMRSSYGVQRIPTVR